jgi:hypothetical protein
MPGWLILLVLKFLCFPLFEGGECVFRMTFCTVFLYMHGFITCYSLPTQAKISMLECALFALCKFKQTYCFRFIWDIRILLQSLKGARREVNFTPGIVHTDPVCELKRII